MGIKIVLGKNTDNPCRTKAVALDSPFPSLFSELDIFSISSKYYQPLRVVSYSNYSIKKTPFFGGSKVCLMIWSIC